MSFSHYKLLISELIRRHDITSLGSIPVLVFLGEGPCGLWPGSVAVFCRFV